MTDLAAPEALPAGRHLLVIFNPTAGRRRRQRLKAVLQALERLGCRVTLRRTGARGDAEAFARDAGATEPPVDLVVAAGGDGTINEVINGLAGAAAAPPLALLPLGTANVLACEIGLPATPDGIAREIASGRARPMPVARANGRCFAVMAGAGFDAHVVAGLDPRLKRRLGKGAYVVESLRQLFRFGFPRYRVTIDGTRYEAGSVIVARGRFYGGRYVCAPAARLDAAELHVCLFERGGRLAVPLFGAALVLGLLPRLPGYRVVRGRRVTIEGPPGDPVQGDGDVIARLPVTVALDERPLAMVVPAGGAGGPGGTAAR